MPAAQDRKTQNPPVLNPTEARQGVRGVHLIWVLVISLGLIVVIYAVMVGGLWNGRLSQPGGQTQVQNPADSVRGPPSQPRQSENPQTSPANAQGQGR
jgi:hypothetical protein